jgi:F-type H+-transporting ATPase subunit gamma
MGGLKEIRTRIASVKTTRQVTSAMKMVSAAKLKKAQDAILLIRPYADRLHEILVSLSTSLRDLEDSVYTKEREPEKVLIVLITSNRGLCGGFNMNIVKRAVEMVNLKYNMQNQLGDLHFYCIGKMGERQVKIRGMKVVKNNHDIFDDLSFENVNRLTSALMKDFVDGTYDRIDLVYNQFRNAAVQNNIIEQFLPVEVEMRSTLSIPDYIFEPSRDIIIREVIPKSIRMQFFKVLLDSYAAEQGARMTAMNQATDNATELLKDLMLQYNKVRQSTITNEILEIVNGAEALRG